MESSSVDIIISVSSSLEFPGDQLLAEVSRALKPGGTVLIYTNLKSDKEDSKKVSYLFLLIVWLSFHACFLPHEILFFLQVISSLERRLLLSGFLEAAQLQLKSALAPSAVQSFVVSFLFPSDGRKLLLVCVCQLIIIHQLRLECFCCHLYFMTRS